jgi:phosphoribosyl 1,2-cyclic phosphate phosphodiesterase
MIGCSCRVCVSSDPRNRRRRSSLYVEHEGAHIVIDTPPDFREQALAYRIPRVDAVLFTHSHADHIFGFDDIRRFNTIQDCAIPAYGSADTIADLKRIFEYIHSDGVPEGVYRPRVDFRVVSGRFDVGGISVEGLPVEHGNKPVFGYLLCAGGRSLAYVPDCHRMADEVIAKLRGVDVMILDALRIRPHRTHLTVEESAAILGRIGAGRSFMVHMCHDLDHEDMQKAVGGRGIQVAHDGLSVDLG